MALLRDHADRVNVQRHFNLGTTILLCLAKQTSPGKKKSLCRSSGRIRPENYSCAQQGHPLFHLKEDQTKFPVPGQKQCSLLMGIHKHVFFQSRPSRSRANGLLSTSLKALHSSQMAPQVRSHFRSVLPSMFLVESPP